MMKLFITIDRTQLCGTEPSKKHKRSNSQQSQPSKHTHREAPKVYRHGRRAYKNMTAENSLYNTIILSTTGIIPNRVHESLKLLYVFPALYIQ